MINHDPAVVEMKVFKMVTYIFLCKHLSYSGPECVAKTRKPPKQITYTNMYAKHFYLSKSDRHSVFHAMNNYNIHNNSHLLIYYM